MKPQCSSIQSPSIASSQHPSRVNDGGAKNVFKTMDQTRPTLPLTQGALVTLIARVRPQPLTTTQMKHNSSTKTEAHV